MACSTGAACGFTDTRSDARRCRKYSADMMLIIDAPDHTTLALLAETARRTLGDIGKRVGLSAPAVKRRIDRLEAAGVILGYTTRVDHPQLGRPLQTFTGMR